MIRVRLTRLQEYLDQLFNREKLAAFPGEHGFTYIAGEEFGRIGYATNLTPGTITAAAAERVDLLVTHHDAWDFVYWMKERCLGMMAELGLSHYFNHAPLDDADFGTNASLMKKIGIRETVKSNLYEKTFYTGRVGEFAQAIPFEALVRLLESILEEPVLAWKNNDRPVRKVGVVTGGGLMTGDVREIVELGGEVYITGERVLYTIEYARFAGINLVVGSHTFTEIFGVEGLALKIKETFGEVTVIRLKEDHLEAGPLQGGHPERLVQGDTPCSDDSLRSVIFPRQSRGPVDRQRFHQPLLVFYEQG